jgi:hypothetical protein
VQELLEIREASAINVEFAARSYFPTMTYEQQLELMEKLATEVAPNL